MNFSPKSIKILYFFISQLFIFLCVFENVSLHLMILKSIIGLFIGIYVLGDELRSWIFYSSKFRIDGYEIFALNIAFSISVVVIVGFFLSITNLFTQLIFSLTLGIMVALSSIFSLVMYSLSKKNTFL